VTYDICPSIINTPQITGNLDIIGGITYTTILQTDIKKIVIKLYDKKFVLLNNYLITDIGNLYELTLYENKTFSIFLHESLTSHLLLPRTWLPIDIIVDIDIFEFVDKKTIGDNTMHSEALTEFFIYMGLNDIDETTLTEKFLNEILLVGFIMISIITITLMIMMSCMCYICITLCCRTYKRKKNANVISIVPAVSTRKMRSRRNKRGRDKRKIPKRLH
jgi:hypothetical protein